MIFLVLASIFWAMSFGLIKYNLSGVDPFVVTVFRLFLSFLLFAPFMFRVKVSKKVQLKLLGIGAVQYGIMYIAYIYSFRYLTAYEVAFFTILTPLYVTILYDIHNKKFNSLYFLASVVVVVATGLLAGGGKLGKEYKGFLLMQISNVAFAIGQVWYKKLLSGKRTELADHNVFGMVYLGGILCSAIGMAIQKGPFIWPSGTAGWLTLLYLGILPSGVAFYLWNMGVRKTRSGTFAVMNNLKIPLAMLTAIIIFGEQTDSLKLAGSLVVVLLATLLCEMQGREKCTL